MFSNFGRSFVRPVAFWVALLVVCAIFYLGEHEEISKARGNPGLSWAAAYFVTTRDALAKPPACAPKNEEGRKKTFAGTNPVRQALYLSLKNALVGFDTGREDAARRMYGCLYGVEVEGRPLIPDAVSLFRQPRQLQAVF